MTTVDVLLPCRRFDVEVTLGAHDGLSLVEQFLLRALTCAPQSVDALASALALPQRMVLDTVLELLGRGLVDGSGEGKLVAHAAVQRAIGDPALPRKDWHLEFQSANLPEPQVLYLLQDLVAGEVFRASRFPRTDRSGLSAMPENELVPEIADIPRGTLLTAVTHALREKSGVDLTMGGLKGDAPRIPPGARVLGVQPRRSGTAGGPSSHIDVQRAMLPVQVTGGDRGDDEPPRITVTGPATIPRRVRRSIAMALDSLWHQRYGRGAGQFFDRIANRLTKFTSSEPDLLATPSTLREGFETAFASDGGPEAQHARRAAACDLARPTLEYLASRGCKARIVAGTTDTFRATAIAALAAARHQVVLACPWIRELGRATDLQGAIRQALRRNVNVVLIWGIDSNALEDPAVKTFLDEAASVSRETTGALVLAPRGAISHAKAIVQDLDVVTVCSANFLNAPASKAGREVGVQIVLRDDERVSLPAQEVLASLRRLIPDYVVQARCLQSPVLFGRDEVRVPFVFGPTILPPQTDVGELGVRAWQAAWDETRRHLIDAGEAASTAAELIWDAQHRALFVWATATAKHRVGVASHRVSPHGLSQQVADSLRDAQARGVVIRLSHDSVEANDMDPVARSRIDDLRATGVEVTALPTHAKFLVCDDWAIVSSYNFLSADPGLTSAHELGLRLFDPVLVDELWRLLE